MKLRAQAFIFIPLLFVSVGSTAQDAEPAAMLAEPYFDRPQNRSYEEISVADFSAKYTRAKKPPLMVIVGRSFSGFVSDWHASVRIQSNTINKGNQANTQLPNATSTDISIQERGFYSAGKSQFLSSDEWSSLEDGFRETLLSYRVGVINQNLATRLLDAKLRDGENSLPLDDSLRTEMDVLRHHSKYLIEVVPYQERSQTKQSISFKISISSLSNAQILAEKKVSLHPPAAYWRAGSRGYELQQKPESVEYQAGSNGYEAIETTADIWFENGQVLAKALIACLHRDVL